MHLSQMCAGNITIITGTDSFFHSDLIAITNPKNHIGCANPKNSQRNFGHFHLEYSPFPSYYLLHQPFDIEVVVLSLHYFSLCFVEH